MGEFGYIPMHAKPDDAVAEIDALVDVYDGMVAMWEMEVKETVTMWDMGDNKMVSMWDMEVIRQLPCGRWR